MGEPESAPSDLVSKPLDPALEQMIARIREAIAAGLPTEAIEREIAERFSAESSALIAVLRAMQATGPDFASLPKPAPNKGGSLGDTWTMSGPVTWASPPVDGTNSQFGRFELQGRIGAGGSGVVFKARDPQLGRMVALKVARAETLFSQEAKSRFTREARVLAALRHPNIIPVFEAGEANGLPYIVQELCDGPNLADWLREQAALGRPVPIMRAARWAVLTAKAVAHAHAQGIVHRDLKPANVLLEATITDSPPTDDNRSPESYVPRITDFGIAKLFGSEESVTATVAILGTAAYMAPEQAEGKTREVGAPADVYSLGVMLYEMLSGRRPIEGSTDLDTLRRLGVDEPRGLREQRRDVPRDLEAICLKCLEKDPTHRYRTANDLVRDLERFLEGVPVEARPVGFVRRAAKAYRRQRRAVRVAATSLLIVLFAGTILLQRIPKGAALEIDPAAYTHDLSAAFNLWNENAERLRDNPHAGEEMTALLKRYIPRPGEADRRGFAWQYLWRLCHPEQGVGVLPEVASFSGHTGDVYHVAFSGDGSRIASGGGDKTARVWDLASGRAICVCRGHAHDVNWVDFSPDGKLLATASEDHTLKVWDAATGREQFTLKGHTCEVVCVLFDSKGKLLVSGDRDGILKLWDLASKRELKSVPAHKKRIQGISWADAGHLLATVADDEIVCFWRMPDLYFVGKQPAPNAHSAAFSRDAEMIALGGGGTITVRDVRSGGLRCTLSQHLQQIESVRFSPDGRQLVSCAGDGVVRLWDLASRQDWVAVPSRLYDPRSGKGATVGLWCVAYSPDGRRIASSARDGLIEVFDVSVTPQWTLFPETKTQGPPSEFAFSPDGSRLAVARRVNKQLPGGFQVWDTSGARPACLTDLPGGDAYSVCYSRDQMAVGFDGRVDVIDTQSGGRRSQIPLPQNWAGFRVHLTDNGTLYVAKGPIGRDRLFVSAYDVKTGQEIWSSKESFVNSDYRGVAFNRRNDLMAALHLEQTGSAGLYELPGGRTRSNSIGHRTTNESLALSPTDPILALSVQGGVELWDTTTCREIGYLNGLSQFNGPVEFSADGRQVLTISREQRSVHVWDVRDRREIFTLPLPHDQSFGARDWHLSVSPAGEKVAISMTGANGDANIYLYGGLAPASDTSPKTEVAARSSAPNQD